jgi:hypothetical protein
MARKNDVDLDLDDDDRDDDDQDQDGDDDRGDDLDDDGSDGDDQDGDDDGDADDDDSDDDGDDGDGQDSDDDGSDDDDQDDDGDLDLDALDEIAGSGHVPYARFAEVSARERQLLQTIAALAAGNKGGAEAKPDKPAFDLKAARTELRAAIIEGDDAKAEKLEAQIDEHMGDVAATKAQERMQAILQEEKNRQFEADKEAGIAAVMRKYPQLDKAGRQTQETLDLIVATRDVLLKRGLPIGKAIRQAADRVMAGAGQQQKRERKDPNRRDGNMIRNAAKTAKKIPPRTTGAGANRQQRRVDRDDISEKELGQMTERQKREARGDFV